MIPHETQCNRGRATGAVAIDGVFWVRSLTLKTLPKSKVGR